MDRLLALFANCGHYGVQLFFVISGYILSLPFVEAHRQSRPSPGLRAYFLRRFTRLEPPYVVNLLLSAVIVAAAFNLGLRTKGADFSRLLPHLLASMVYVHGFLYHDLSMVNGVAWSLEVEVQFYVLMPLLAWILHKGISDRLRPAVLVGVILVYGLLLDRAPQDQWYLLYSILGYMNYFLAGILWAELCAGPAAGPGRHAALWDAAALGAVAVFALPSSWIPSEAHLPLVFATFCAAGLRGRTLPAVLRLKPVWLLGGMCYSIYLYHLWVLIIVGQLMRPLYLHSSPFWANFLIQFPILAAGALLVSAVLYVAIERPCMDKTWPSRLRRRFASARPPAA